MEKLCLAWESFDKVLDTLNWDGRLDRNPCVFLTWVSDGGGYELAQLG